LNTQEDKSPQQKMLPQREAFFEVKSNSEEVRSKEKNGIV
jgi:hypothetical protein